MAGGNNNPFMKWINGVLRPYLRNRLKPLLEETTHSGAAKVAAAQPNRVVPSTNIQRMKVTASASAAATTQLNRTATIGLGGLSAESLILQQQQSSVLASATTAALAAAKRRKAIRHAQQPPPQPQSQQQQTAAEFYQFLSSQKLQAAAAAAAAPQPQQKQPAGAATQSPQQEQATASPSSSTATIKVDVNAPNPASASTPSRFKRCYYVPVMNPLPDLKEKQLAVLDMRLFGIRDMPTFKERTPSLPPSVLGTAKLRGLSLLQVPEMVAAMEEQGSEVFLSAAGPGSGQAALPFEEEEEEEREEEREGRVVDGKGF